MNLLYQRALIFNHLSVFNFLFWFGLWFFFGFRFIWGIFSSCVIIVSILGLILHLHLAFDFVLRCSFFLPSFLLSLSFSNCRAVWGLSLGIMFGKQFV